MRNSQFLWVGNVSRNMETTNSFDYKCVKKHGNDQIFWLQKCQETWKWPIPLSTEWSYKRVKRPNPLSTEWCLFVTHRQTDTSPLYIDQRPIVMIFTLYTVQDTTSRVAWKPVVERLTLVHQHLILHHCHDKKQRWPCKECSSDPILPGASRILLLELLQSRVDHSATLKNSHPWLWHQLHWRY